MASSSEPAITFELANLHWLSEDPQTDLCCHGNFKLQLSGIPKAITITEVNLTAAAVQIMQSVYKDWFVENQYFGPQIVPCCGHIWYRTEDEAQLFYSTCPVGLNWRVLHNGMSTTIDEIAESTTDESRATWAIYPHAITLPRADYAAAALAFANRVRQFYEESPPRKPINNPEDKDSYKLLWNTFQLLHNHVSKIADSK